MARALAISAVYLFLFASVASSEEHNARNAIDNHQRLEDLANERFPVDLKLMEKRWGIDCNAAIESTKRFLGKVGSPSSFLSLGEGVNEKMLQDRVLLDRGLLDREVFQLDPWETIAWEDIYRCGLLFNTHNTGRFQPCPNYSEVYRRLNLMRRRQTNADKEKIQKLLMSDQCDS